MAVVSSHVYPAYYYLDMGKYEMAPFLPIIDLSYIYRRHVKPLNPSSSLGEPLALVVLHGQNSGTGTLFSCVTLNWESLLRTI